MVNTSVHDLLNFFRFLYALISVVVVMRSASTWRSGVFDASPSMMKVVHDIVRYFYPAHQ